MLSVSLILYLHGHPTPASGNHDPSPDVARRACNIRPAGFDASDLRRSCSGPALSEARSAESKPLRENRLSQRCLLQEPGRAHAISRLAFLLQLPYSFLNLLHLLVHCLCLLLQRGQLLVPGQVLGRRLWRRDGPLGKPSAHTHSAALAHAPTHTAPATPASAHALSAASHAHLRARHWRLLRWH